MRSSLLFRLSGSTLLAAVLAAGCAVAPPPSGNQNDNIPGNTNRNANRNTNVNANSNANENSNANDNATGNGNGNANGNVNDNVTGELVTLSTITFDGDVLAGVDPTGIDLAGGQVDFSNGVVAPLGILSLNSSGTQSWLPKPGTAVILFTGLDVRRVELYFADFGSPGATLSARTMSGDTLGTINTVTTGLFDDPRGQMSIDGGGESIARLVIVTPTGVTVSVDDLELTVFEAD